MTTTDRGYGWQHQKLRAEYVKQMKQDGYLVCARCGEVITPEMPFDLGHDDYDRSVYTGPEHANECNRAAGARKGNRMRAERTRPEVGYEWF